LAEGAFIAFQDSDDEWLPGKLEKQLEVFSQDSTGRIGLVVCGHEFITDSEVIRCYPRTHLLNYQNLLSHFTGHGEATQRFMFKRSSTSSELFFDETLPAWEEWDLLFRISRICQIGSVKDVLVRYYRHGGPQ
jgi:hypothetical protein